tara:strand:- start:1188 stop:1721 length:534 start_codon:yes stop_codon:yes gene_type:complete
MASIIKANQLQDFGGNSILTSDGAGNLTTQKTNYPAFEAYLSSDQDISDATNTKVNFDTEVFDTDNCYDNSTNYRFTPTVAGKYFIYSNIRLLSSSASQLRNIFNYIYKNGSAYRAVKFDPKDDQFNQINVPNSAIIDMNGSSDYIEMIGYIDVTSGTPRFTTGTKATFFGAYRIGS